MLGFGLLTFLLFFAGMVSLFELNRLNKTTKRLLEGSSQSMDISRRMLDAVQDQNTALLQMVLTDARTIDPLFVKGQKEFLAAYADAYRTTGSPTKLEAIGLASDRYNSILNTGEVGRYDETWFLSVYKTSYYELTAAIKDYMNSSHQTLLSRAEHMEGNAYRLITPSVIAIGAAMAMILMLFFFLDIYFIKPLTNITKSLESYLIMKVPFKVKIEGKDEVLKLKEMIESLIQQIKNK